MAAFIVFYDANLLYPAELRNFLMHLALIGVFRAKWSTDVHEEWISSLLERRPDLTREKLERTRRLMDKAAPDALVTGYEHLISGLVLPDEKDRHVLALTTMGPPPWIAPPQASSPAAVATAKNQNQERPSQPQEKPVDPDIAQAGHFNSSVGKKYALFEGTIVPAVLMNRLNGSFTGPVNCLVTENVYSRDRQHVLIPAGSKVFGEARQVNAFGQQRLAVFFHRLIMPDGYSVSLDQFKGLDQAGATALHDKVNNHYLKIFGASLAVGILGGFSEVGTGSILTESYLDQMRLGFGESMAMTGEEIMNRFLNLMPTITIREGTRVEIYLSNDLLLPDYTQHTMPADF